MPLHLLGKKSWNVYNPENIARVKRDEAAAEAKIVAQERDQLASNAADRLKILRGERSEENSNGISEFARDKPAAPQIPKQASKRRKLAGECDTDRDIRLARPGPEVSSHKGQDAPLMDSSGHIDLLSEQFRASESVMRQQQDKAPEGMRFKDAGGYNTEGTPWYANKTVGRASAVEMNRDVWGNEDPRRRERQQQRTSANDPLLAMKKGVKRLRENERERQNWMEQRERDLYEIERLAEKERKRRKASSDNDSLEEFRLDGRPHTSRRTHGHGKRHKRPHRSSEQLKNTHSEDRHKHHRRHRTEHRARQD